MTPYSLAACAALFGSTALAHAHGAPADTTQRDTAHVNIAPAITVTSTRAEIRRSPVVYSEITREDLQRAALVTDIPKMLSDLPSTLSFSENGNSIGYTNLTMRGFDQRRIAVLINGIPQNDPEDHNVYWINFPDIASNLSSIQVQRGAGLVNYGAAAIGGSVNLTTSNFVNQRMARITTGIGWQEGLPTDQNTLDPFNRQFMPAVSKTSLELSSGMVGQYAFYGRISRIQSQGYREMSYADLTSWFFSVARFDEKVSTQINVFGGPIADGLAYTGLPRAMALDAGQRRTNLSDFGYDSTGRTLSYSTPRRAQEMENFSQPHVELLNDWFVSDSVSLKSSMFYYRGEGFFDYDAAWSVYYPNPFGLGDTVSPTNAIVRSNVDNRQVGWIPRIVWKNGIGELTAGLELRWHRSEHWGKIQYAEGLPVGYDPDYKYYNYNGERDIQSAFARQTWRATEDVTVNAELQVVHHRYGITNERQFGQFTSYQTTDGQTVGNGGDVFNVNYVFANPRLGVNWNIDDRQNAFLSVAYTSREPRRNNLYAGSEAWTGATPQFAVDTAGGTIRYDFSKPLVRPERMLDIEAHWEYGTADVHAGVTAYMMNFTDELVKNGQRDIFGLPIEGNAPRTQHMGIELDASVQLLKSADYNVSLWGNTTISRNRIVEYAFVSDDTTMNLSGNPISGFPEFMGNLGLRSRLWNNLVVDVTTKFIGEFFTDNFGDVANMSDAQRAGILAVTGYAENRIDPTVVTNVGMGYTFNDLGLFSRMRLKLQVNNVADRLYVSGGNGKEFFPAAQRSYFLLVEAEL